MAKQLEMMYEGKAKQVFATDDPTLAVIHYKDDATAFNGLKKGTISGKGAINNRITNIIMKYLEQNGIETHLIEELNERDTLVKRVQIVPLEVIMRNVAAGSMSKRVGVEEGTQLAAPSWSSAIRTMNWATPSSTMTTPSPSAFARRRSWRPSARWPAGLTSCSRSSLPRSDCA